MNKKPVVSGFFRGFLVAVSTFSKLQRLNRGGGEIESQPFAADDVPRQMLFRWWGFDVNGFEKADDVGTRGDAREREVHLFVWHPQK